MEESQETKPQVQFFIDMEKMGSKVKWMQGIDVSATPHHSLRKDGLQGSFYYKAMTDKNAS